VSNFKTQFHKDFDKVFLNDKEFGFEVMWNGSPLRVVEDTRRALIDYETQAIDKKHRVFSMRDIDLVPMPKVAEQVDIDGDFWDIVDVTVSFGHYVVTLARR